MDWNTVYTKTAKGVLQISNKTLRLHRDFSHLLTLVDGKASIAELLLKSGRLSEAKLYKALDTLTGEGLIKILVTSPDTEFSHDVNFSDSIQVSELDTQAFFDAKEEAEARVKQRANAVENKATVQNTAKAAAAAALARAEAGAKILAEQQAKAKEDAAFKAVLAEKKPREAEAQARATQEEEARLLALAKARQDARAKEEAVQKANREAAKKTKEEAAEKARQEADAQVRAKAEAKAREEAEAEARRKMRLEARAREEAEAQEKAAIEAKARAEAAMLAKKEAEDRALQEIRARESMEAQARQEAEQRARAEAQAKAKAAALDASRIEAETKARAEVAALAKQATEEKVRQEARARDEAAAKAKAELQVRQELEQRAREEAQAKAKAAAEEKARIEAETKARAEVAALAKQEAEQRVREEAQANAKAAAIDAARIEAESKARADADEIARQEAGAKSAAEERARLVAEAKANAQAEAKAILEAEAKAQVAEREQAKLDAASAKAAEKAVAKTRKKQEAEAKAADKAEAQRWAKVRKETRAQGKPERQSTPAILVKKSNKPVHWVRGAVITLLLMIGLPLLAFFSVPLTFYAPQVEKILSDIIQEPVTIGTMRASLLPMPHLKLEQVAIGQLQDVRMETVRLTPEWMTLTEDKTRLKALDIDAIHLDQEVLPRLPLWLKSVGTMQRFQVNQVHLRNVQLALKNIEALKFDADIQLSGSGAFQRAQLTSADSKLDADVVAEGEDYLVYISGKNWQLPVGPRFIWDEIHAKAMATSTGMHIEEIRGALYGGKVTASGRLSWVGQWHVEGEFKASNLQLERMMPLFTHDIAASGTLHAIGSYTMQAVSPAQLFDAPAIKANFNLTEGAVGGIDLVRAIQFPEKLGLRGGQTQFSDFTGSLQLSGKHYQFSKLKLVGGLLNATGAANISPGKELSGRLNAQLGSKGSLEKAAIKLSGSASDPILYPLGGHAVIAPVAAPAKASGEDQAQPVSQE